MANSRIKLISKILCLGVILIMGLGIFCACDKDDKLGEFYTLQEAYDNGLLSKDGLLNIAYYQNAIYDKNNSQFDGFIPMNITPETLSEEKDHAIRQTYLKSLQNEYSDATIDDIHILAYYGEYSGCIAVRISCAYFQYLAVVCEETIGEVKFVYGDTNTIRIWKETK